MEFLRTQNNTAKKAAERLAGYIDEFNPKELLLMCSGSSALEILKYIDTSVFPTDTTITVLDERYGGESNFEKLLDTKIGSLPSIDPRTGKSVEEAGVHFEEKIREWVEQHEHGLVIATLGVGTDGHTAGMFPGAVFPEGRWFVGYKTEDTFALRITATYEFLRDIVAAAVVYMTGEEKRAALENLMAPEGTLQRTPARIIHEMRRVTLVTNISKT